jgi:phospholipid transport system substrate-binding protein
VTTMNKDPQPQSEHMTVARHNPSWSCSEAQTAALEFGRFRLLPRRRQLIADGKPIKLSTRSLDLLLALVDARGSLVAREDLLCRAWPGIHVSEQNLKVQIFALRKAVGEVHDFIQTEIRRGYRFTAPAKPAVSGCTSPHPAARRQRQHQRTISRWRSLRSAQHCSDRAVHRPSVVTARLCKALAFAAVLAVGTASYTAHAALAGGSGTVQNLYNTLLSTMKNGGTLGESGRFTQVAPVIRSSFDVASMARLSVGPFWTGLSEAQRQQVTESYGRYISAIYADRFDSYHGQTLEVTGEQAAEFGLLVTSRIIKSNGEPVEVDYIMRRNGGSWLIYDIYLDSTISEVATRRSEFAAILKTRGIDGLIAALNRKADILTGTTAKAF